MAQQYFVGPVMMIDWGEDDSPPKLERSLLSMVFGGLRPYWRRGALALGWILGQSVPGLAPAVQDTFLFHASIRENLLYARPAATEEMLAAAVRDACLDEFIRSLPDASDTAVGERGHRLSGGEKQRVVIARVILMDPRILILGVATSHVDTLSEHLVQAALHEPFNNRTSLVIAHPLSTVLAADQILAMNRGRTVERGTDHELVEQNGLYATLYERQFRATTDPDDLTAIGVEPTL
jgi:ATP-binding cassette subfamily B protein